MHHWFSEIGLKNTLIEKNQSSPNSHVSKVACVKNVWIFYFHFLELVILNFIRTFHFLKKPLQEFDMKLVNFVLYSSRKVSALWLTRLTSLDVLVEELLIAKSRKVSLRFEITGRIQIHMRTRYFYKSYWFHDHLQNISRKIGTHVFILFLLWYIIVEANIW